MSTRTLSNLALLIALALVWPDVSAEDIEWRKGLNARLLPQYCQDRLDEDGAWQQWRSHFGPLFIHMHHYCGGLYAEQKARTIFDKRKRAYWVREVIVQMRYVSRHCDTSCPLYDDLHRRWAWALSLQGNHAEAAQHLGLVGRGER